MESVPIHHHSGSAVCFGSLSWWNRAAAHRFATFLARIILRDSDVDIDSVAAGRQLCDNDDRKNDEDSSRWGPKGSGPPWFNKIRASVAASLLLFEVQYGNVMNKRGIDPRPYDPAEYASIWDGREYEITQFFMNPVLDGIGSCGADYTDVRAQIVVYQGVPFLTVLNGEGQTGHLRAWSEMWVAWREFSNAQNIEQQEACQRRIAEVFESLDDIDAQGRWRDIWLQFYTIGTLENRLSVSSQGNCG
ncbi:uncharacterized protein BDV14DRAFT_203635 [Aspergillus stella-maris]|uniref:uncharacterized protein n=1 Tax=Aspergillus stella-maris TaxID=1810926 RepID=UPI003CCDE5B8